MTTAGAATPAMAPRLTFYGDDFTGSSAVAEVLHFAGVPTALLLDLPTPAVLAKLTGIAAIGIAGIARSKSPEWMAAELPRVFAALSALGAPLVHYKTCSTFDSAPHLGSIGRAVEIGLRVTGRAWAPLVVGAPAIGRYQIFGNLFANFGGVAHRLDRHPVMARHPATPMQEADLCRHLDAQTALAKAVIDWRTLKAGGGATAIRAARDRGAQILAFDVFDDDTLAEVGRLIWQEAEAQGVFAAGSQGVEYALVAHWRRGGALPAGTAMPPAITPAGPLLVVSGSCSPTTAAQITAAGKAGFALVALDAAAAPDERAWRAALDDAAAMAEAHLAAGRNALVHTARGPDDPAIARLNTAIAASGVEPETVHARIGAGLGRLVRAARARLGLRRAIFSGGDTSGHAMLALGAEALIPLAPLAPGVPLMRLHAADPAFDGLEVALKGGQMGADAIFIDACGHT